MFLSKALLAPLCLAVAFMVPGQQSPKPKSIQGVWQVSAVVGNGDVPSNNAPQPGLIVFTAKHFSIVQVNTREPRTPIPEADRESGAAWAAVYGNGAFSASAGTYEVNGDRVTLHAFVSKNPGPMGPGKFVVRAFKLSPDGMTLTLSGIANQNGPTQNEPTYTLRRVE